MVLFLEGEGLGVETSPLPTGVWVTLDIFSSTQARTPFGS